jgi:peptidoglycan biosynthesis protein MviN/MurJ (putative lipid II flippase)
MVTVMFLLAASKLPAAGREMVISYRYGLSTVADGYYFAFTLASWLPQLWTSIAGVVLIPVIAGIRGDGGEDRPFNEELMGFSLTCGLGAGAMVMLAGLIPGVLPARLAQNSSDLHFIVISLAALPPLGIVAGLLAARLMAEGRYANTLIEGVPPLVLSIVVLGWPSPGPAPLIAGTLAGYALYVWCLQSVLPNSVAVRQARFRFSSPHWPAVFGAALTMAVGTALLSATTLIDQYMVSAFGPGAIARLGYATRILTIVSGVGAIAISRPLLPILSGLVAQREPERAGKVARKWAVGLVGFGVVVVAVAAIAAPVAVRLLYERGAFTAADTTAVTTTLQYCLIQLPFYFPGIVLVQYHASMKQYRVIALGCVAAVVVKIVANLTFQRFVGLNGIVLGTAAMYLASTAVLFLGFRANAR